MGLWVKLRVILRVMVFERVIRIVALIGIRVGQIMGLLLRHWWNLRASAFEVSMMVMSEANNTVQVVWGTIAKKRVG